MPAADSSRDPRLYYAGFEWASAVPLVLEHLPDSLVAAHQKIGISKFARSLLGTWSWGMFETRLAEGDGPVDLLAAMVQSDETRRKVNNIYSQATSPALEATREPMLAWARNDGSRYSESPALWIEWDRGVDTASALQWLCTAPDFLNPTCAPLSAKETAELARSFLDSQKAGSVPGAADTLIRLMQFLPPGGKLMAFSSLKPRGRNICRVFARLPPGQTAPWLERIGWPGDREQLHDAMPMFRVPGEDEWCQIEFAEEVGPYLALELAQTERGFPRRDARERWLTEVAKRGWATPEKASSVLDWHGQTECTLPGAEPVRLLRSFHLKVAFAPGSAPLAKAYLGFYFRKKRRALAA